MISRPRSCWRPWSAACAYGRCRSRRSTRAGPATFDCGQTRGGWPASSRSTAARSSSEHDEHPDLERRRHPRPRPRGAGRGVRGARAGDRRRPRSGAEWHVALAHVAPSSPRHPHGAFQVDGTPTDCVLLAIGMLMPDKPDFVISGINHGQNMGEDVFYSGTVAAAMEGLVAGVPSVAVSYAGTDVEVLETHKEGLRALLARIVAVRDFPKETLLNINLPAIPGDQVKGIKVTHLSSRVFSEEIALMKDPWGKDIYWIGGGHITWSGGADSDFRAVADGYISVTPLHMDMTNYGLIEVVRQWFPTD